MIRCVSCGEEYDDDEVIYTCEKCGSVLELVNEIDVSKDIFDGRRDNLWKFKECIPVDETKIVSLDEGGTPFCKCDKLGKELGVNLYVKVEGSNPTGSFKDRGMTVGMTKAMELGVNTVGCASTGNTSASLSAYAARAGLRCIVFLPSGKVALGKLAQAMFHGAEVMSINGNFDEALEAMTALALEKHLYLLNSINPYRLEGQKTIGYEIVRDLGWQAPDRIVLPVGNAGNISAIWKEYERWIANAEDAEILDQLRSMDEASVEDAFYCDLAFGTGGLRGVLGAGTNRMNVYTVRKATQGLANYLTGRFREPSVVIGYDSRLKSDAFSKTAAAVFAANGVRVWLYPCL